MSEIELQKNTTNKLLIIQEIFIISVLPVFHIIGIICNIICAKIFATSKFKNNVYRYLTANSIFDAIFLAFFTILPFTQCLSFCEPWLNKRFIKLSKKYIAIYLARVIDSISSLINVSIIVERLLLNNKISFRYPKFWYYCSLGIFMVYSGILYSPNLNILNIDYENSTNKTQLSYKINKRNKLSEVAIYFQHIHTILMTLIAITSSSIVIWQLKHTLKTRNRINKYSSMKFDKKNKAVIIGFVPVLRKNSFKNGKNASMLVILLAVLFILNQFSYIMVFISFMKIDSSSASYNFIIIIHSLLSSVFHGSNIFIYYKYNKEFSMKLKQLLKIREQNENYTTGM